MRRTGISSQKHSTDQFNNLVSAPLRELLHTLQPTVCYGATTTYRSSTRRTPNVNRPNGGIDRYAPVRVSPKKAYHANGTGQRRHGKGLRQKTASWL
nr:hypothetical protein CFP56_56074 [Quercus suber]